MVQPALLLGVDTGGTYTDAVVAVETEEGDLDVVSAAKSLTTRHDLSEGIRAAIGRALVDVDPAAVGLVSMSTTLATNAIVEGHGGRVCLVAVGFSRPELTQAGVDTALDGDPLITIDGGHNSHGDELAPLDLAALDEALAGTAGDALSGFAVVGQFGVRNPSHELAVQQHLRITRSVPVTCSHELTAKLNGPKRAVTSVLNARLIGSITDLIESTRRALAELGVSAPLMVVRGDGSLIAADVAVERPIETIMSGPAASVVGARFLSGARDAVVSDIGGTTTDVAILRDGEPELRIDGARVGGHTTMVEAVDIHTIGLGGDSQVTVDDRGPTSELRLGPRRVVPVSLLATSEPELVHTVLDRQLAEEGPRWLAGQFALLTGRPLDLRARSEIGRGLIEGLVDGPRALRDLVATNRHAMVLDGLVAEGAVLRCGFTPTDACHVLGLHGDFDAEAARKVAELTARSRDRHGVTLASSGAELSERVVRRVVRSSAEVVLAAAFERDGHGPGLERHPLTTRALDGPLGMVHVGVRLGVPLVAVGASAATYYPAVAHRLGTDLIEIPHASVANAIGAVAGQVRVTATGTITRKKNGRFNAHAGETTTGFDDLEAAAAHVESTVRLQAAQQAERAGADAVSVEVRRVDNVVRADGESVFVDSTISAVARARPRLGTDTRGN